MQAEDLLTMSTDTLLSMREIWRTEGKRLLDLASRAEFEILRKLQEDNATVYASEQWEAKVSPGAKSYTYNMDILRQLSPLLRPEDKLPVYEETVVNTVVDKRALNLYEKRGGEIARIISEATTTFEGQPRLAIKRIGETP